MLTAIKGILSSKKAIVAITSGLAAAAAKLGWDVDTETIGVFLAPIVAYILGQAHVDHAKETAKIPTVA